MSVEVLKWKEKIEKNTHPDQVKAELWLSQLERKWLSKEIADKLSNMTNKEFLKFSMEERFRYITKWNLNYNDVKDWDNIEFTFTYNWRLNRDLYLLTTAWQVLPNEVRSVQVWWEVYTRVWLNWEFFNVKNKRLTIHESTKITVLKTENTDSIVKENKLQYDKYIKNNPEISSLGVLVKSSIDKWISPDLAVLIFWEYLENFKDESEKKIKIEELITKVHRVRWTIKDWWNINEHWKYPDEFVLRLLKMHNKDWKKAAKDYGIDESKITSSEKTSKSVVINFDKLTWTNLSWIDLRWLKDKYPREASIKNNNPAWITYNETFARTLSLHWIDYYIGTARPANEWWNYFWFPNMEEWMNAFNLLWEIKIKKMWDKPFSDFAKNWAVDYSSYQSQFADIWDQPLSSLNSSVIDVVKSKQMKIESPWMYAELSKLNMVV